MSITGLLVSSLVLILAAGATLVYGWVNASQPLVIASVVLSAAASIAMAMGLYRSRPAKVAAGRRPAPKKKRARAGRSGK